MYLINNSNTQSNVNCYNKYNNASTHSFQDVLTASHSFKTILQKANEVIKLNQTIAKYLDPTLAPYCRVANLKDGVLILTTPSPTWGHLLRFTTLSLLTALRSEPEWIGLKSIKIHVRPNDEKLPVSLPELPLPRITEKGAKVISQAAVGIKHDGLKAALERLATRYKTQILK